MSQIGSCHPFPPGIGMKIEKIWNHHLGRKRCSWILTYEKGERPQKKTRMSIGNSRSIILWLGSGHFSISQKKKRPFDKKNTIQRAENWPFFKQWKSLDENVPWKTVVLDVSQRWWFPRKTLLKCFAWFFHRRFSRKIDVLIFQKPSDAFSRNTPSSFGNCCKNKKAWKWLWWLNTTGVFCNWMVNSPIWRRRLDYNPEIPT